MNWLSYYAFWLILPAVVALVSRHPAALGLVVVALVLRRVLPDPYLFFKHLGRVRSLRAQIDANAENAEARVRLAMIYLEKRRPARALPLLDEARRRDDSAELHFLRGLALLRAGRPGEALEPLVVSVDKDPKVRYGEAFLRAGDAAAALGRLEEAEDAYERYAQINTSSIEARAKLAALRERKKDAAGARAARDDARATWRQLPAFQRRRQWLWYMRALYWFM